MFRDSTIVLHILENVGQGLTRLWESNPSFPLGTTTFGFNSTYSFLIEDLKREL